MKKDFRTGIKHWSNWLRMADKKEAFESFIEKTLSQSRYIHIDFSGRGWSFSKCLRRQGVGGYPNVYVCLQGIDGWLKMARNMSMYTKRNKFWHPYLINTIELRSLWMEIKYIKSTARLLDRDWVNKGGLDLSKEVLWVSVGQRAADLRAVKVGGQQIILLISPVRTRFARAGLIGRIFCWPLTLTAHRFAALWPTETHSTSLERSKPPLLTQSLFKSLAVLLMYFISIHSDLISIEFIK